LAGQINRAMPDHVVGVVAKALNDECKPIRGSRILLAGLAYKPNVDDERESPTYAIMQRLEALGAQVLYNDPYVPLIRPTREHPEFAGRASAALDTRVDAIVIVTAHDEYRSFDWAAVDCPVIDSRNLVAVRPKKYYRA
jgi:UDP-N-acetyl-D-glucosamine dehydrogenase